MSQLLPKLINSLCCCELKEQEVYKALQQQTNAADLHVHITGPNRYLQEDREDQLQNYEATHLPL